MNISLEMRMFHIVFIKICAAPTLSFSAVTMPSIVKLVPLQEITHIQTNLKYKLLSFDKRYCGVIIHFFFVTVNFYETANIRE